MLNAFASVVLPTAGGPQTITSGVMRRNVNGNRVLGSVKKLSRLDYLAPVPGAKTTQPLADCIAVGWLT